MLRRLSVGVLATATIIIAPLSAKAEDGTAEVLSDVMSISLKDVVQTTLADCTLPMPSLEFLVGLHMPTNNDLTIGDSLSYDKALDTRYSADCTWRFKTCSGFGNQIPESDVPINSEPSIPGNHDEQVQNLYSCLVGIA